MKNSIYHWENPLTKVEEEKELRPASKEADKSWFAGCGLDHPSSKWTLQIISIVEWRNYTEVGQFFSQAIQVDWVEWGDISTKMTKIRSKSKKVITVVECRNCEGKPIILPSQSITKDSNSVQAGDDAHLKIRWSPNKYCMAYGKGFTWIRGSWCRLQACLQGGRGRSWGRGSRRACEGTASGSPLAWSPEIDN